MESLNLTEGAVWAEHYHLSKRLGRGSFASVWLAHDTESDLDVAIKIFDPDWEMDEEGKKEFKEEFRLVFNLNHTNILHISHYDIFQQHPYIILPFCSRGSAASLVGRVTEQQVWQFLEEVAAGLDYLHHLPNKIIHQDIKPANILIDDNGHFLITDFGISLKMHKTINLTMSAATEQEQRKALSGTLPYMGPERFGDKPQVIMASDIWSLGASAYELIENDVPFGDYGGETQKTTQHGQEGLVGNIPAIKANVSDELKQLIYSCLNEATWNRPSAAAIVEQCRERRKALKAPSKVPVPKKSNKATIIVLSVVALCVLGGIVAYLSMAGGGSGPADDGKSQALLQVADSIISETKARVDAADGLIESSDVSLRMSLAKEKLSEILDNGGAGEPLATDISRKVAAVTEIMDSCVVLRHLSDTIGELYNEGRVVTADEFKKKQEELSQQIKTKVSNL